MFRLSIHEELFAKAEGSGRFFAKKGSMVADQADHGEFKYSKRLIGTNGGNIVGQVLNQVARKVTGENLEIMEIEGSGTVYLADQGAHVTIIGLEPNGVWNSVCVESEDLLAFTDTCHYGITPIGVGVISQKGFFTSKLTFDGEGAQVAVKTNGNPLVLKAPCRVDPDAVVAWTGKSPRVKVSVGWKTLIGQTSGESYMYEFNEPGQIVIVQPFERESGLKLGMDDNRYRPEMQDSSLHNTVEGLQDTFGNHGGGINPSQRGGGLGGLLGNIMR